MVKRQACQIEVKSMMTKTSTSNGLLLEKRETLPALSEDRPVKMRCKKKKKHKQCFFLPEKRETLPALCEDRPVKMRCKKKAQAMVYY